MNNITQINFINGIPLQKIIIGDTLFVLGTLPGIEKMDIIYETVFTKEERKNIDNYLTKKYSTCT